MTNKIKVAKSLLLIDKEIFGADGRLLAKCYREDVAKVLLNRLNSQPGLLNAGKDALSALNEVFIVIQEILRQYGEYDATGRRAKLPIEKTLESAVGKLETAIAKTIVKT